MKDINKPLRDAYFTALTATGYNSYYLQAPDNVSGNYIIFNSLNGSERQNNTSSIINVSVSITLYAETVQYNSGEAIGIMAGKIYDEFYPNPQHTLTLASGFQMIRTELVSDVTNPWRLKNQLVALDRIIIFRHSILVN